MKVNKNFGKIVPFVIAFLCCLIMIMQAYEVEKFSNRVFFTSLFIQLFSIFCIFSRIDEPFSLYKMFYLFNLFFFGVAPLLQFFDDTRMWISRGLTESEYFVCNLVSIFIIVLYFIFYNFYQKFSYSNKIFDRFIIRRKVTITKSLLLIALSSASFFIVLQSNGFNIFAMLLRGGQFVEDNSSSLVAAPENDSPTIWLIINNFIRPLSIMCYLFYMTTPDKNKIIKIILLILALLTCFPTAMPRFAAAAMYIPVLLLTVPYLRKKNIFSFVFVIGLLFVFPFLNVFRTYSEDTGIEFKLDFEMFTQPHFDNFQNFALVLSNNIVTYGNQLFGVLLFWVPRSVWPDKPIGSGAFSASKLNFSFDNVSTNFFAEGYINFGLLGIILFIIGLAFLTSKFDNIYWKTFKYKRNNYFSVLYTVSIGFLFFILRGDLMSSVAYLLGFLSAALLVFKIAK